MSLTFTVVSPALIAAHYVADYWFQTTRQSNIKGNAGWDGRLACVAHVATYTATALVAVLAAAAVTDAPLFWPALVAGLGVSAVTHYIADRRAPLRRIAGWFRKDPNWLNNGGLHQLDQSWHIGWLFVAALIMA